MPMTPGYEDEMTLNGAAESPAPHADTSSSLRGTCIDNHSASSYLSWRLRNTENKPENPAENEENAVAESQDLSFSTVRNVFQQVLLRTLNLFQKPDSEEGEEETLDNVNDTDGLYSVPRPEEIQNRVKLKWRKEDKDPSADSDCVSGDNLLSTSDNESLPEESDSVEYQKAEVENAESEVEFTKYEDDFKKDEVPKSAAEDKADDWLVIDQAENGKNYDILVISQNPEPSRDLTNTSRDLNSSLNSSSELAGIPTKARRVRRRPPRGDISLKSVAEDVFPTKPVKHVRRKKSVEFKDLNNDDSRQENKENVPRVVPKVARPKVGSNQEPIKAKTRYSIPSAIYTIKEENCVNRSNLGADIPVITVTKPRDRRKSLYDSPGIFEAFVSDTSKESEPSDPNESSDSSSSSSEEEELRSRAFHRFSRIRSNVRRHSIDFDTPGKAGFPVRRNHSCASAEYLSRRRNTVDLNPDTFSPTYPGYANSGRRLSVPTLNIDSMDEDTVIRKGPVMGTSGLAGRQQVYLQAYMERYGRRRSQPDAEQEIKLTLSSQTLSRVAKSETLSKYIRRRLENQGAKDETDSAPKEGGGTALRRSMTVTSSGHAKPHFSQSFSEGRRPDRSPKMSSKNMRSCTDPGFLSDSSECGLSPAASVSSVDSQPSSPSRSRQSFGSNSSLAKFFRKSQIRSRFHIPTLDDLKRKKKPTKSDKHAELNKRRSLQFEGQMDDDIPSVPVHKTLSAGGLDGEYRNELCPSNHGYGQSMMVDDHWAYRRGRSMKATSARLCGDYQPVNLSPQEVHKATSYNTIPLSDRGTGMNRVQSDSRIPLSMTESLPPHWLSADANAGSAYFYDSSDNESNYEAEPFRYRNKSAQSLVDHRSGDHHRTDRDTNRMCQSYTEYHSERFTDDPDNYSESLVNVTQTIYSCFASDESKGYTNDIDNSMSARQRRRLLKEAGRTCSHPDSLPRLERTKNSRRTTPDTLSPNQPSHSLPNSRPGSQPNSRPGSRSQSPQPLSLTEAIREAQGVASPLLTQGGASPLYPEGVSARRRIYSSDDSTETTELSSCALTRARSLPGGRPPVRGPQDAPYIPDDWGAPSPSGSRLEVPGQYDSQTVVRSSSDVTDVLHESDRQKSARRRQRHYKSDPFTEIGRDGQPINYHGVKEKLLAQSASQNEREPRRSPSCEESTSSGSQIMDRCEEEDSFSDTEVYATDTISKKKKASICDDCEAAFIPARELATDMDHLCKHCDNKRTERRKAILEIVNTEFSYGRDLKVIKEEFYAPMQSNSLLSGDQVQQIFLNLEELINVNSRFTQSLEQAIHRSRQNHDHNFNSIHIGKFFLENSLMFLAFENYCIKHTQSISLLERLEKEKELLRIFLEVSQNENQALRRMNLKSFLMIPVQRVFKYPLLLSRLHQATPSHHKDLQTLKEAQNKIEKIIEHINACTKSNSGLTVSKIKTKGSISRRQTEDIEIQKTALSVVGKQHNEAVIACMGKLHCALPTELVHWTSKKVKFTSLYAVLISNVHVLVPPGFEYDDVIFPKSSTVTEASLVLLKEKNGKYVPYKDFSPLGRCIISVEKAENEELIIEVQEMSKDAVFLKGETISETYTWLKTLRYQSKDIGTWRRRRHALANIMISKPSNTSPS